VHQEIKGRLNGLGGRRKGRKGELTASRSGLYSAQKYNFAFCFVLGVKVWDELRQRAFGNGVPKWVFGNGVLKWVFGNVVLKWVFGT